MPRNKPIWRVMLITSVLATLLTAFSFESPNTVTHAAKSNYEVVLGHVSRNSPASVALASGTGYYVDSVAGSDANSGTSTTSPWKSLTKVNGRSFSPGDTINLKRGSSWSGGLVIRGSGASGSPITVQAYGTGNRPIVSNPGGGTYGEGVDIYGSYVTVQGLLVRDAGEAGIMIRSGANYDTILDNEVTAAGTGVTAGGQHALITKNSVHDLKMIVNSSGGDDDYGAVGFWITGPYNEVSYNQCVNCKAPSYDYGSDGGFVEIWQNGDATLVHHNYAKNTEGFFEIGGNSGSARDVKVYYNTLVQTNGALCLHNGGSFAMNINNLRFENNTLVDANPQFGCMNSAPSSTMLYVRNNIFSGNSTISSYSSFTHNNNTYTSNPGYSLSSGEKIADPRLVNVSGGDYRLQSGSPAVDAGLNLGYPTDYDGCSVPGGAAPEIGAYEYGAASSPAATLPSPTATPGATTSGDGLLGTYFNNMTLSDPAVVTHVDPVVNFNWGSGSPQSSVTTDRFSIRWTGYFVPPATQTYTFYAKTDDGVRLWVNNVRLIDNWVNQGATEKSGSITLTGGVRYAIRMEYYENGGNASAVLSWSSASVSKQVIPQSRLYSR